MRESVRLPPVEAVDTLDGAELPAFLAALTALQGRVAARLAVAACVPAKAAEPADGRLLTIAEVAQRLGVTEQYAYALVRRELRAVRFGKYVRVWSDDLDRWIAQHCDEPLRPRVTNGKHHRGHGR